MRDEVGMNCEMCTDRALVVVLPPRMGRCRDGIRNTRVQRRGRRPVSVGTLVSACIENANNLLQLSPIPVREFQYFANARNRQRTSFHEAVITRNKTI